MKNIFIDNRCLGSQMLLVDVRPIMFDNGKRLDTPTAYYYDICLPGQAFEKLPVKIAGAALMDPPTEGYIEVKLDALEVRPYVRDGRIAYTASATGIRAVEKAKT